MSPKPHRHKLKEYLDFAAALAEEAGQITLRYFRSGVAVETKSDASPVTIADRETEQFIRDRIIATYPDHGILGEEHGEVNAGARWRWIVDPIDGTQSFIHGVPLYTTLIALECSGDMVAGVIHCPPQAETVAAAVGYGCAWNGQPCRVSDTASLDEARLNVTDYADLLRRKPKFAAALLGRVRMARGWADAYSYLLVATGRADLAVDPVMSLWDCAPLKPIIEEAGGVYTDFDGAPSLHTGSSLASNGKLHAELLELARLDREF
jgi:histidinol phosphatase-like enzyme (inositol monophosphatase family)